MSECICNGCRNLKAVFSEEGDSEEYQCKFGYPSDQCEDCSEEDCQETCSHYVADDEEETAVLVRCGSCGKEMLQAADDSEEGEVYCFDCYLKRV